MIYRRIWHLTEKSRLPDFIGSVPSVTLDKWYYLIYKEIIALKDMFVNDKKRNFAIDKTIIQ